MRLFLAVSQPLSALNIIITLLSSPTSRAFRIFTVTFELVKKRKKEKKVLPLGFSASCRLCSFVLSSPLPVSPHSRGNLHTWANDHIMDSLVGSQWLPITVESWSKKNSKKLNKIIIKGSLSACCPAPYDIRRCNYSCFSVHPCVSPRPCPFDCLLSFFSVILSFAAGIYQQRANHS